MALLKVTGRYLNSVSFSYGYSAIVFISCMRSTCSICKTANKLPSHSKGVFGYQFKVMVDD